MVDAMSDEAPDDAMPQSIGAFLSAISDQSPPSGMTHVDGGNGIHWYAPECPG